MSNLPLVSLLLAKNGHGRTSPDESRELGRSSSVDMDGAPSMLRINPLMSSAHNSDGHVPPPMFRINPLVAQAFASPKTEQGLGSLSHNLFFHGSDLRPPRNRKPNYSENEKQIFFALIGPHVDVLDAKSQERQIMTMKTEIWKEITAKYNEIITKLNGNYVCRDSEELKTFWKNVRRSNRRRSAVEVPDLSDRMGMDGGRSSSPTKIEGSSNYLTCSPLISAMSGMHHEDMMSGAGPSSSSQDTGESEAMQGDYDQDDIDVKSEPAFNVEPEICEDESQTNTQSSCDRRSSQSSPPPAGMGMAGPYLLKKETHCTTILDQLLRDDTFCDVTLTAEGQSMRAHKIVLCLASAYFRQVLSKESNVQNVIVFRDIKFMELKNLINFIYTGEATVDAAELESFMKTAEMLEVTSLCDGQRKLPKNLIPKPKESESEKNKTTFAAKRSAHNSCVSPPPSKARKIDDSSKSTPKSVAHPSTSGGGMPYQPQVTLHAAPIKTEPPAEEDQSEEFFEESGIPSPTYQQSETHPSVDPGSSDKAPVGKCPFCPSSQPLLKGLELTNHMTTYHPEKTVFPCENCSHVFLKRGPFEAHQDDCNR